MAEALIRQYQEKDRSSIRQISWDTALMGEPAGAFFEDKELFQDFLTKHFTDYEPESSFVAENEGRVIGYLTGAKNESILAQVFSKKILPDLLMQAILRGTFLKKKNITYLFNCLLSFFRQEFSMPDFSKDYPAILHINIEQNSRRKGIGERLIAIYLDYLAKAKVSGVHLATMSSYAASFFSEQGFKLLHIGRRSYFSYILKKDLLIYIYGKRLE